MNKNIIKLLPLLVLCYSCLPIASPPSGSNQTKVQLSGDFSNADSVEVTVKDIDCAPAKPCTTNKYTIDPKSGNNFINVTYGNKQITVVQIKNGKAISQNTYTKNILNDGNVVVVTASSSPILPTATPTISINPSVSPSSEVSPAPTVVPSENPTISPNPTVTPSPSATPRSSGGGGRSSGGSGGGGTVTTPTPPPIQASTTVAPDVISVK